MRALFESPLVRRLRSQLAPLAPYLGFIAVFRMYHWLTGPLNLPFRTKTIWTEVPLVLAMFATSMVLMKARRGRAFAAAMPVFFLYGAHDYYVWVFGEVPDFRQFARLPELIRVSSWLGLIVALGAMIVPAIIVIRALDLRRLRSKSALVLVPWIAAAAICFTYPADVAAFGNSRLPLKRWSKVRNAQFHGRLITAALRELEQRAAFDRLEELAKPTEAELARHLTSDERAAFEKRSIHVVVLESFIDASRLSAVRFSRPPLSDEMLALIDGKPTISRSPHPIGGTAESEFELLCGVPALGAYGYQEFKMFSGSPVECLPRILESAGIETRAAHPFLRAMYNRTAAYRSLGFGQTLFLDDGIEHVSKTSKYVLDENLYRQLLPWVQKEHAAGRTVFNYVLTMEGHSPHKLDPKAQPVVVKVEPYDEVVEVLANKTYYRSRALAEYIAQLNAIDPDALIIAVADHLPPIPGQGKFYDRWKLKGGLKQQWLLVVDRGEVLALEERRHFHLYQFILDRLTSGAYCERRACFGADDTPENRIAYATLLMRGMGR